MVVSILLLSMVLYSILHLATNNTLTSPFHLIWFLILFPLLSNFIICLHTAAADADAAAVKHLYVCTC